MILRWRPLRFRGGAQQRENKPLVRVLIGCPRHMPPFTWGKRNGLGIVGTAGRRSGN